MDYESSQLSKKINALQKDIGAKKKARDGTGIKLLIDGLHNSKCRLRKTRTI